MSGPRYTPLVTGLPATVPFVGPETIERRRGAPFTARLGANESLFGPSPKAIRAMAKAAETVWKYCDPETHDLKHALAEYHGVSPDCVLVGEGIDGILGNTVRLFVSGPEDVVVTSDGAYPTFNYHVAGFGGTLVKLPYRDDHEDLAALSRAAREHSAKLVYLCNPDNPMGSHHPARDVASFIASAPRDTVVILDEAYIELAPGGTVMPFDTDVPNLLRMRTFSKAFGMAGARIGYAIGHPYLIAAFDKVRNHFGVNHIAQKGAIAALEDRDWLDHVRHENAGARERLAGIARENGLTPLPSATNFVTMDTGGDADFARAVVAALEARGIFIRMPFAAPGNRCIRVSCGGTRELDAFATALPGALAAAQATRNLIDPS